MTIPLFLFAIMCLVYLLEIQAIRFSMETATHGAAKITRREIPAIHPFFNPVKFQADLVNLTEAERLDRSIISGGSSGIRCWATYYDSNDESCTLKFRINCSFQFPEYTGIRLKQEHEFQVKAWTGYADQNEAEGEESIVYITETGIVYHTDYRCSYLQLSVQFVPAASVEDLRNESGGIYHACDKYVHGESMAGVYITNYGTKYHNSLNCSGLKRYNPGSEKIRGCGRWGHAINVENNPDHVFYISCHTFCVGYTNQKTADVVIGGWWVSYFLSLSEERLHGNFVY